MIAGQTGRMARKPLVPPEIVTGPFKDAALLPPRVAALRDKILAAAASGDIEALRIPIQWNETPPLFARAGTRPPGQDVIAFLKSRSRDGRGAEMLAIVKAVFEAPFAKVSRGPFENYVWPACVLLPKEDEETRLILLRCTRFADLSAGPDGAPLPHRAGVGADGTWHTFWTG